MDTLLSSNPVIEAEHAISAGDKRYIVIPVCTPPGGEVIPGWPIQASLEVQIAMEQARRPVACNDISWLKDISPAGKVRRDLQQNPSPF